MSKVENEKFNLEERTSKFAESVIDLCKKTPKTILTIPILNQLIRSGTSIGANYFEANGASSRKDFKNKIYISKKEAKETMYWLRLLAKAEGTVVNDCKPIWQEAKELTMIFSKIIISTD